MNRYLLYGGSGKSNSAFERGSILCDGKDPYAGEPISGGGGISFGCAYGNGDDGWEIWLSQQRRGELDSYRKNIWSEYLSEGLYQDVTEKIFL